MAACRQVYDSRYLQADCQEPESAPKPYARQSSKSYLSFFSYLFSTKHLCRQLLKSDGVSCGVVTAGGGSGAEEQVVIKTTKVVEKASTKGLSCCEFVLSRTSRSV